MAAVVSKPAGLGIACIYWLLQAERRNFIPTKFLYESDRERVRTACTSSYEHRIQRVSIGLVLVFLLIRVKRKNMCATFTRLSLSVYNGSEIMYLVRKKC